MDSARSKKQDFLIRPSPLTIKSKASHDTEVWKLASEDIEKEFLEIDMLTPEKLAGLAKNENLDEVTRLEFRVDTTDQSISQIGEMLPNLEELILNRSVVSTFRDFGTSLRNLRTLHLASSFVKDIDGIAALDALTELYIDFNNVKSLTPLAMHENLEVLSLKDNMISGLNEIDQLGTCFKLRRLTLIGNPVSQIEVYRAIVFQYIPQLKYLDDLETTNADRAPVSDIVLERTARELEALEQQTTNRSEDTLEQKHSSSPLSLSLTNGMDIVRARPSTPRGESSSSPYSRTSMEDSPGISHSASTTNLGTDQSNSCDTPTSGSSRFSASSELTHGADVVFAGNLVSSMRRRRRAAQLETNERRLRQATEKLELEKSAPEQDDETASQSSGGYSSRREDVVDDDVMQRKLEELLELSSGLEKELHKLQSKDDITVQSPKAKLLRKKKKRTSSSTSKSSSSRSGVRSNKTNNEAELQDQLKAASRIGRSSSAKHRSRHATEKHKASSLKTSWTPSPPVRSSAGLSSSRTRSNSISSKLAEFMDDLGDNFDLEEKELERF